MCAKYFQTIKLHQRFVIHFILNIFLPLHCRQNACIYRVIVGYIDTYNKIYLTYIIIYYV